MTRGITFIIGLFFCGLPLTAQDIQTDYAKALTLASEQNKGLLILFMDDNANNSKVQEYNDFFFNTEDFKTLQTKFVMLKVDCTDPSDNESKAAMYCRRVTSGYNKNMVFPSVIATNTKFVPVGELQKRFSEDEASSYLEFLKSL